MPGITWPWIWKRRRKKAGRRKVGAWVSVCLALPERGKAEEAREAAAKPGSPGVLSGETGF